MNEMMPSNVAQSEQPTITVMLDTEASSEMLKKFHCPICGKVVFEYYSPIHMILPGEAGPTRAPKVIQCHNTVTMVNGKIIKPSRFEPMPANAITKRCNTKYHVT